ncbi:hypothetical protein CONPUDRAFT_96327 [Coniophora puteana RWD-64-598 SS2]|uniref:RRM domain-containing protein n=1 Tax=Coniophora puteana (strain RWD-64-598) TaxID=741705 RepID=A0A5M3N703_CONPW|nr:uncharacterized protein CONPUDRAFT_96327 [Coniophora puteana RWD-64-598 SS2]EIW87096.1 hypothetical protein CONPUDRAFT_96327 [Coniophora puteana RWD-64-598 SS2]
MAAASTSGLSASVTRILALTGFSKDLKTKDFHTAFSEWENVNGGYKIKWRDDTSLLIVFQDASAAKRAYLNALAFPPSILTDTPGATIKPYDGPDAQVVIQTVNTRGQHASNPSRGHNIRAASISVFPSRSSNNSQNGSSFRNGAQSGPLNGTISEHSPRMNGNGNNGREHSPTLPTLPSHPSLNDLINSVVSSDDPAIVHAEGPPKIGDPGKRMLGAALGVRHPGLGPRAVHGGSPGSQNDLHRAMGGLTVAE